MSGLGGAPEGTLPRDTTIIYPIYLSIVLFLLFYFVDFLPRFILRLSFYVIYRYIYVCYILYIYVVNIYIKKLY